MLDFRAERRSFIMDILFCHNHPSGVADIETTQQLVDVGKLLNVPVQDHVIVSRTGYFSFREQILANEYSSIWRRV